MATKGNGPAPLDQKVIKTLLDRLTTDDDFRELFQRDASAALAEAGHRAPAADAMRTGLTAAPTAGGCLQMQDGAVLASKEAIAAQRAKLESTLAMIQGFMCPPELLGAD
jgi:putative modified peptide